MITPINHSYSQISRRDFMKLSAIGTLTMIDSSGLENLINRFSKKKSGFLGRILKEKIGVHSTPHFSSTQIGEKLFNEVLSLRQSVLGDANEYNNRIWHELNSGGYIHSSGAQWVSERINPVVNKINRRGQLATVTVPFTRAFKNINFDQKSSQILFYGSNHWVVGIVEDDQKSAYYRIKEDRWGEIYLVNASHLHVFTNDELSPISSSVPDNKKLIEVDLRKQILRAHEGNIVKLITSISSGTKEPSKDFSTPCGEYKINLKRPSRHLPQRLTINSVTNELYGVPWLSNFTNNGIAIHGAYWHNNFGYPTSHGCINVTIPVARWLYLWSQPVVPPLEKTYFSNHGTRLLIY